MHDARVRRRAWGTREWLWPLRVCCVTLLPLRVYGRRRVKRPCGLWIEILMVMRRTI